jgi:hypothetical protein
MAQRAVASTVSNAVELGLNLPTGVDRSSVCRPPPCSAILWPRACALMKFRRVVGRGISECPDCRPTTLLSQPALRRFRRPLHMGVDASTAHPHSPRVGEASIHRHAWPDLHDLRVTAAGGADEANHRLAWPAVIASALRPDRHAVGMLVAAAGHFIERLSRFFLGSGPRGRRFKSSRPDQISPFRLQRICNGRNLGRL